MSLDNKKIKKSILSKIINSIFVCGGGCNTEHVTIPTLIKNSGNLIKNEMNLKEMKIRTNVPINSIYYTNTKPCNNEIKKFPYTCPICFRYFNKMLKSSCCGNYCCFYCIQDNYKFRSREKKKKNIQCNFCSDENFIFIDVNNKETIHKYTDSPIIEKKNKDETSEKKEKLYSKICFEKKQLFSTPNQIIITTKNEKKDDDLKKLEFDLYKDIIDLGLLSETHSKNSINFDKEIDEIIISTQSINNENIIDINILSHIQEKPIQASRNYLCN